MIIPLANRLGGVKPYYFVEKLNEIRAMIADGKDVISFAIGSPDMTPDSKVVSRLSETAGDASQHGYQAYQGLPELREAMSTYYKNVYKVDLDPANEILPLMGSKEGVLHLTLAFVNPGDKVFVPNPGYPTYTSLTRLLGGDIVYYDLKPENNWYPDFDQLDQFDFSDIKILWVNYPHMPTGTPAKREVFERLVALAKDKGFLIVHDNPYSRVLNQKQPMSILEVEGARDVCIELNSLSKSHNMAGWRVGMMVGQSEYVKTALRVKSNIDSGMFAGLQTAAASALALDDQWHDLRNEQYENRRKWAFQILDKLGFEYDLKQEGMFVWAKPIDQDIQKDIPGFVDRLLREKNIFFTPGMIFGSNGEGYVRLSLCVPAIRMEEAFKRLQ